MTLKIGHIVPMVTGGLFYPVETGDGGIWDPPTVESGTLDVSPAILLRAVAVDDGKASLPDDDAIWPAYIASLPDGDNVEHNAMAFYDTAGVNDGSLMIGPVIRHYGVQIKVRAIDYQTGWQRIDTIAAMFDAIANEIVTYNSEDYVVKNISRSSAVLPMGNEAGTKRRFLFSLNFIVTVKQIEA